MYSISTTQERSLLWLLALIQFTIIMDFMVDDAARSAVDACL